MGSRRMLCTRSTQLFRCFPAELHYAKRSGKKQLATQKSLFFATSWPYPLEKTLEEVTIPKYLNLFYVALLKAMCHKSAISQFSFTSLQNNGTSSTFFNVPDRVSKLLSRLLCSEAVNHVHCHLIAFLLSKDKPVFTLYCSEVKYGLLGTQISK